MLESLDCDGTRSIGQCAQSVLNQLVLVFAALGCQIKVMVQKSENILRILNLWQELDLLVGPMHYEIRSLPLLLGVGVGDWDLHDNVEQPVTLPHDFVLQEEGDQLCGFRS